VSERESSSSPSPSPSLRFRSALVRIVGLALVLRLALLLSVPWTGRFLSVGIPHSTSSAGAGIAEFLDRRTDRIWLTEDEHSYDELARRVLAGQGLSTEGGWMVAPPGKPTSYGGFTYPAIVTAVYAVTGGAHQLPVFLLQIVLGALTVVPVALVARRAFGDGAGVLAALLAAVAPGGAWSSVALMTEAIFVPLVATSTWALLRAWDSDAPRGWAVAGIVIAITCLTRSTLLYFLPIVVVGSWVARPDARAWGRSWAVLLGVFAVVVAPWAIRNLRVHGEFLLLDTKAGTALWQFNNPNLNPVLGLASAAGEPPVPIVPEETVRSSGGNEVRQDRRYRDLAVRYALAQPVHFASVIACRAVLAASPMPLTSPTPLNVAAGLLFRAPLLLLAVVGWLVLRRDWRRNLPLLALPLYWWALQAVAGPGQRYRVPVEFAYLVLASGGALAMWRRARARMAEHPATTA
jgi:4-amino-4-deoxy-L-arabinose transferase-like glycosyltransferase